MTPGAPRSASREPHDETEFHLPADHWPLPELVHTEKPHAEPRTADFVAMSKTPEYLTLRKTFRGFAFPMTIAGLASYFLYVVLSIYAPAAMATPLIGSLNVGMTLGLAQFAVTYGWTAAYVTFANKRLDPTASALKAKLEKGVVAMMLLETYGNPAINIAVFAIFVAATMGIVIAVTRQKSKASDFYTGGAAFSGRQNGLAITGDYLSAAAFLGVTGAIAIYGYDGLLYSVGFFVAWIVALFLVAEPLRNTGKYTMADVLSFRMQQKPVRTAAATSTLVISFVYLLAQMAGAGGLVALLLGVSDRNMQSLVIALVGLLMVAYVLIGGMKGTTWVQMIKAVLLVSGAAIMAVIVLYGQGFNLSSVLHAAQTAALDPAIGNGKDLLKPMQQYGATDFTKLSFLSLSIALVAGPSGLPHVLMRFYTVPTAKEARRSAVWAIALVGAFFLVTLVLGMGAAYLVGQKAILAAPGGANAAAPLLALKLGGEIFMGVISGVAFATILAVVAGLTITASASFAHDVYNSILKDGNADPEQEVKVARITSVVIAVLAILGGIVANGQNIAFLISLAFAVAASANLPSILYTMYWRRFNTRGSVWSIYTGLLSSVLLIVFSPSVSGSKTSMLGEAVNFAWFPLTNPALVSVPLAFLAGWLGTITSGVRGDEELAAEMEVRSMTGAGAGEAIAH